MYGSGFPKSLDVSKAIDKAANADREVIGLNPTFRQNTRKNGTEGFRDRRTEARITAPATDAARQWEGWGTALKPALEPITMARKPLTGTVADNVMAHGVGALNIDACRVEGIRPDTTRGASAKASSMVGTLGAQGRIVDDGRGRWPANLIHDGSDDVLAAFPMQTSGSRSEGVRKGIGSMRTMNATSGGDGDPSIQSSKGSAARFFYCAKAGRADRNDGLPSGNTKAVNNGATMRECERADWSERNGNHHPTVKPTDLMRYLCRLITPPGGTVLDPFMGSGSTGRGALAEGFRFIGIEIDPVYSRIAEARIGAMRSRISLDGDCVSGGL
jgi:hypothetical protein